MYPITYSTSHTLFTCSPLTLLQGRHTPVYTPRPYITTNQLPLSLPHTLTHTHTHVAGGSRRNLDDPINKGSPPPSLIGREFQKSEFENYNLFRCINSAMAGMFIHRCWLHPEPVLAGRDYIRKKNELLCYSSLKNLATACTSCALPFQTGFKQRLGLSETTIHTEALCVHTLPAVIVPYNSIDPHTSTYTHYIR